VKIHSLLVITFRESKYGDILLLILCGFLHSRILGATILPCSPGKSDHIICHHLKWSIVLVNRGIRWWDGDTLFDNQIFGEKKIGKPSISLTNIRIFKYSYVNFGSSGGGEWVRFYLGCNSNRVRRLLWVEMAGFPY
jgi:hypothetical protein